VRHANELAGMSPEEMAQRFNAELGRAARAFDDPTDASKQLIDLHVRHGRGVRKAIAEVVSANGDALVTGAVPETSLLGLVVDRQHLTTSWRRLAERIGSTLERGIPLACQSHKPNNEPHLQQISDGILQGAGEKLVREFPYLRWASRMTKPDWSDEAALLWVELKYVRTSSDVTKSAEAIAADITKYGDNQRRTLFVIYDPNACITDADSFRGSIERHPGNLVKVIR
jgi:hypothetical protein